MGRRIDKKIGQIYRKCRSEPEIRVRQSALPTCLRGLEIPT